MDVITKKISELPAAGTLDGTELLEVVKDAANNQTSIADIRGVVQTTGQSTAKVMSQKAVTDTLSGKADKEVGKQLSDENYTLDEKDKLGGIASEATKNRADSENANKVHGHDISDVTGLSDRLDSIDALIGDVESVLVAINGEP